MKQGARKAQACQVIGISVRTLQRWRNNCHNAPLADKRSTAVRNAPSNKLSDAERQRIMEICNSPEFSSFPPNVIVPTLADRGIYIASESTFYRVLKANKLLTPRRRERSYKRPGAQKTTAPNQVWSWDSSYLPTPIKGRHLYLYMMMDIFSRKIVGADVFEQESGEQAAELLQRCIWKEKCAGKKIILHSDNGGPMRSYTLLAKMYDLGGISSYSRPRVSNDNPYSESLFRTVKYCPQWPAEGFTLLNDARAWVAQFVNGYNLEHKHSGIKYVTPDERHREADKEILAKRKAIYELARAKKPERWSKGCRNWNFIHEVMLNPEVSAA